MAGRDAPTLSSGRGLDLAAPGLKHARFCDDVRHVALARLQRDLRPEVRRLVDADDLVSEVNRRILRRNQHTGTVSTGACGCCLVGTRGSAWSPERGSWTHYVDRITSCAIEDLLAPARRIARHELMAADPDREDEHVAPEPDSDARPFDPEAAPSDPDDREVVFLAACCLHVFGELPVTDGLATRALRQREQQLQESLFGPAILAFGSELEQATAKAEQLTERHHDLLVRELEATRHDIAALDADR